MHFAATLFAMSALSTVDLHGQPRHLMIGLVRHAPPSDFQAFFSFRGSDLHFDLKE